jgi:hypothetical protein
MEISFPEKKKKVKKGKKERLMKVRAKRIVPN